MKVNSFFRVAIAAAFCAAPVMAGFNTGGQKGAVRTLSAPVMGIGKLNIGSGISIFQSVAYVSNAFYKDTIAIPSGNKKRDAAGMLSADLFMTAGLTQFWDLGISLPFYYDWLGFNGISDNGIGDLEISTKFLYPPVSKRLFYQGYYAGVTIPVGMKNSGLFPRNAYYIEGNDTNPASTFYSSEYVTVNGLVLLTFDFSAVAPRLPLQAHINLGGVISSSLQHQRNTAIVSLALEYIPFDFLEFFLDFHGESRWSTLSASLDPSKDPMLLSPGVRLTTASGLYLSLTGDISLSSRAPGARFNWHPTEGVAKDDYKYSTSILPNYGVQFTLGWCGYVKEPDQDKDSIPNSRDKCPRAKEDFDGFQDNDGCPDFDNDGDGIPDSLDKCPDKAEDFDGFQDADGCPDSDNDSDGIMDSVDKCPDFPEDFDGFQDADGCPDFDNDRDGIKDSVDKCPNDAEDFDGFQDADGCPDFDNEQDGVPDTLDKCPNVAGIAVNHGCPPDTARSVPGDEFPKSQILRGLNFRRGTAELTFESYQFLEPVIRKLKDNPDVEIELHGHTEGMGDYMKNMQLSQMRAEAVRQYFISKGIAPARVRAVGFGSSSPIADNKTAAGRAENRRIEMVRVK